MRRGHYSLVKRYHLHLLKRPKKGLNSLKATKRMYGIQNVFNYFIHIVILLFFNKYLLLSLNSTI